MDDWELGFKRMILQSIAIRIDQVNAQLDAILKCNRFPSRLFHKSQDLKWMIITAWNPRNEITGTLSDINHHNQANNSKLLKELQQQYRIILPCWGIADSASWPPEASFLVFDVKESDLEYWLKTYDQHALVYGQINQPAQLVLHPNSVWNSDYLDTTYLVHGLDCHREPKRWSYWKTVMACQNTRILQPHQLMTFPQGFVYPLQEPQGQYLQFQIS